MKNSKLVLYRRKREGRTNYRKRLILLKGRTPRLVIRKTNTQVIAQIVEYSPDGDRVIVAISSNALKKLGWNYSFVSTPACYLAGMLLGKKAKAKNISEAIPDFGLRSSIPGSKLYAVIKGVVDAGIHIPVDSKMLPSKERLAGVHIANYFQKSAAENQFSAYKKNKVDASKITSDIEMIKKKIMS
jgi:large subunit ribosomal protein L18